LIQKERFNDWTEDLTPYLTIWKERLGDNPSIESILKEITKTKFDFFKDESSTINYWGYMWVLKQFGYDCNPNEIDAGLKPILELRELDRFEKNVISPPNSDETNEDLTDLSTMGGYAFEEYMAKIFRKMGYTVDITPKSRDQGADLVIKQNNDVTVVQVKNYTSSVSNSAIQEVVAAKGYYHANKAMVVTSSFFTPSAIDLALANDVILWDCEKIKKILSDNGACI
jgi:Predicted endonuclease distantly related to archaeal Holliday junction resolvase and Mrr-like restriction enzymes